MASMARILHVRRSGGRGGVVVEFSLVAPIMLLVAFATIEFGLIFKDLLVMNQAAREGARQAALGAPPGIVASCVLAEAPTLRTESLAVQMDYRFLSGGGWSTWRTLEPAGDPPTNNAGAGAQVRVRVVYSHQLATGRLFSRFTDDPETTEIELRAQNVTRRE